VQSPRDAGERLSSSNCAVCLFAVTDDRRSCPMAVVFRDELDRDTVVRTACGRVSSSSPISHRGHAPASSSSGVVYRSTTNRLQIHAAQSDRGFLAPDDHWTPYILEYMCMLHLFSNSLPKISPYTFLTTLLPSHPSLSFLFPFIPSSFPIFRSHPFPP